MRKILLTALLTLTATVANSASAGWKAYTDNKGGSSVHLIEEVKAELVVENELFDYKLVGVQVNKNDQGITVPYIYNFYYKEAIVGDDNYIEASVALQVSESRVADYENLHIATINGVKVKMLAFFNNQNHLMIHPVTLAGVNYITEQLEAEKDLVFAENALYKSYTISAKGYKEAKAESNNLEEAL